MSPSGEWRHTRFEVRDHVAYVTIDRPEARNALNPYVHFELSQHWDRIEQDDDIWVGVLTGAGEIAFCAGADLKFMSGQRSDEEAALVRALQEKTRPLVSRWDFPKPLLARLNGHALGGGLELALACDIIVAADHAQIGLPEPRRGLVAGAGGVHRLPRQLPLKIAMGHLLTGRPIPIERALALGLVNEVAPLGDLDRVVQGWLDDIKLCSPLAVRATKQMAMQGLGSPSLQEAFEREYAWERRRRESADAREGPLAFAQKRPPRWQGR